MTEYSDRIEDVIISNLIFNDEYTRKVLPFIERDYFKERLDSIIIQEITKYFSTYNKNINPQILTIELQNRTDLNDTEIKSLREKVSSYYNSHVDVEWLTNETEKFCKDQAIYNALMRAVKIKNGLDNELTENAIPDLLSKALAVSFDTNIGHDYFEDYQLRWADYHNLENKLPFDVELLNIITDNGLSNKTLNAIISGTGVGKSLFMCHLAAWFLSISKNVLYITLEMSETKIAERIDANLLSIPIKDIRGLETDFYSNRMEKLMQKTTGKLIIKEYPTSSAHVGHFRALLDDLKKKKNFKPDIIFVDYLSICASQRVKFGSGVNSNTYLKSVSEELRSLAVEHNVPLFTAVQPNREGQTSTEIDLDQIAESIGVTHTLDLFLAMSASEEMQELGQVMFKQLKNRYGDLNYYKKFVIGIDKSRMKIYDTEASTQQQLLHSNLETAPIGRTKSIETSGFIV